MPSGCNVDRLFSTMDIPLAAATATIDKARRRLAGGLGYPADMPIANCKYADIRQSVPPVELHDRPSRHHKKLHHRACDGARPVGRSSRADHMLRQGQRTDLPRSGRRPGIPGQLLRVQKVSHLHVRHGAAVHVVGNSGKFEQLHDQRCHPTARKRGRCRRCTALVRPHIWKAQNRRRRPGCSPIAGSIIKQPRRSHTGRRSSPVNPPNLQLAAGRLLVD